MGPNYYPPGEHDWTATDELRKVAAHNEALLAEKYTHDVGTFRETFFGKLHAYDALSDDFGWAVFDGEADETSVATVGSREVLLMSYIRPKAQTVDDYPVPLIRIITNELVVYEDTRFFLTEEITIDEDGDAQYLMDAVQMDNGDDEHAAERRNQAVMQSLSPIFVIAEENKLGISNNLQPVAPILNVTDPEEAFPLATPFGSPDNIEDTFYALAKAQEILDSVLTRKPSHMYQQPE